MQRPRQVPQHRAQPLGIGDTARQIAEFVADARELTENTRGSGAGRLHATLKVFVMLNDIVELPERVLARDLGAEARSGLTGVTFEGGDGGVLVLDFARDRAKRPVGDVPGDGAAKLAGAEVPGLVVRSSRDRRRGGLAARPIEMVPELVQRTNNLAGQVIFGRRGMATPPMPGKASIVSGRSCIISRASQAAESPLRRHENYGRPCMRGFGI